MGCTHQNVCVLCIALFWKFIFVCTELYGIVMGVIIFVYRVWHCYGSLFLFTVYGIAMGVLV